jgi:two-component system sensor histidine kinase DesK
MQAQASPPASFEPTALEDDSSIQWSRFGGRRTFGRIFGTIWLVNLGSIWNYLRTSDLSPWGEVIGWAALAAFVACYAGSLVFGRPIWSNPPARTLWLSRAVVVLMVAITTGFMLAARDNNIAFIYIFATVLAGLFLPPREAFRWLIPIALPIALSLYHIGTGWGDIAAALLIDIGIGINAIFFAALMTQNRELRRARAEIARLAVSQERMRFARDLHDLLGQSLTLIALKSELADRMLTQSPERAAAEIADIKQVARTSLREVREAVSGYRSLSFADEVTNARSMLEAAGIKLATDLPEIDLSLEQERAFAWFMREGATNIVRHSRATSARLTLTIAPGSLIAELIDDGDLHSRKQPRFTISGASDGNGLGGLKERVGSAGGSFSAGLVPGYGFRIRAEFPLDRPSASDTSERE